MQNKKQRAVLIIIATTFLVLAVAALGFALVIKLNANVEPFKELAGMFTALFTLGLSLLFLFVIALTVIIKKVGTNTVQSAEEVYYDLVKETLEKTKKQEELNNVCEYCLTSLNNNEHKCPNCGATKIRRD